MALGVADGESVVAAAQDDVTAARRLFAAAEAAVTDENEADVALTAYGLNGRPLAWDGRPSELPPDRLQGDEAWFFAQGALGLRLVYVAPGDGCGRTTRRDGRRRAILELACRLAFRRGRIPLRQPPGAGLDRASVRSGTDDARGTAPSTWRRPPAPVSSPRRSTPPISPRTRNRWRRASVSLALIVLALALALLAGPLLDWRNRSSSAASYALAVRRGGRRSSSPAARCCGWPRRPTGPTIRCSRARSTPLPCSARSCRRRSTS